MTPERHSAFLRPGFLDNLGDKSVQFYDGFGDQSVEYFEGERLPRLVELSYSLRPRTARPGGIPAYWKPDVKFGTGE